MTTTVHVRPAAVTDWPAIWPFWQTIVTAGETYAYPLGLTAEQARPLWFEPAPGRVVVAVDGGTDDGAGRAPDGVAAAGRVVGSAKFGPNRPGRGGHVATASFMVDPAHAGRGVGRALALHVLDQARDAGYRAMQFNAVVETNGGAVRLWQALGFEVIGTVPEAFDHAEHGLVGLHVMHRRL